ncbi:MAG TPA: LCP family protein [Treponemataceae bacterium]|nr:LCP family protein [Treponemataceae bacterium]HPS42881.1 LCP family protein [Treponemataceae bacterium]
MRSFRLDRSILFLVAILLILVVVAVFMFFAMRTDPVSDSLSDDKLLKVLVVLEDDGMPISTNIVAYYPVSKRAAMFDIPGETGLILKSLERVDRIDAVYAEKGIAEYKSEIEGLTGISVPFYLVINLDQFSHLADLLSGFNVFIPTPVDIKDQNAVSAAAGSDGNTLNKDGTAAGPAGAASGDAAAKADASSDTASDSAAGDSGDSAATSATAGQSGGDVAAAPAQDTAKQAKARKRAKHSHGKEIPESTRVLLPSGAVSLDGDMVRTYVTYRDPLDQEGEGASRKQKAILAFFRALGDNSGTVFTHSMFPTVKSCFRSNVPSSSMKDLLTELSKIDVERLVPQKVTGSRRSVDGKTLLFPFEDGGLLKAIIRQTLGGLASEDSTAQERVYAIEILNGTKSQGLARTASELYQSFGYDVIRVGNAGDTEYDKTEIIDRIGNQGVASTIGQVIHCTNIESTNVAPDNANDYGTEAVVDFTVILGKDYNGRYVIQ